MESYVINTDDRVFHEALILGCALGATLVFQGTAPWAAMPLVFFYNRRGLLFVLCDLILGEERSTAMLAALHVSEVLLGLTVGTVTVWCAGYFTNQLLYKLPGTYINWLALAVLPIGYSAYYFRKRNQKLYGTIEVMIGLATALGSTTSSVFHPAKGLTLIGAVYIVARGFNNISDAKEKLQAAVPTLPTLSG